MTDLLTTRELAAMCRVSTKTVRRWVGELDEQLIRARVIYVQRG